MRVFQELCKELVDIGGLKRTNNVEVDDMVVMFLHTLGHNIKNRILQQYFGRSGSAHDGRVLRDDVSRHNGLRVPKAGLMLVESRKIDPKGKFVAGAYLLLEDMIERAKPGCGVKADPNIMSRVKTLKQKFLAVQELRVLSGAGWDETPKMVILDDHVFAEYVQNHKHCAKLNKVSFPCYDGLEFVYGKARANGAGAVGLDELREKIPCPTIEVPNNLLLGWEPTQFEQPTEPTGMQNEEAKFVAVDDKVPPTTPTGKAQKSDATSRPKKVRRTTKSSPATDEGDALQPILKAAVDNLQSMTGQSDQTNNLKDNLFK
ncbi:hypothetical protein LINGRAHAP2_LOCUS20391 [Linum grandiflorum]